MLASILALWLTVSGSPILQLDAPGFQALLERHRGQVVVVNFWATWCAPCREEFPDLVRLYEEKKKEGLLVIGISLDEADSQDKVIQFLESMRAEFPAYLASETGFQELARLLNPHWYGALPATFVYDRGGAQRFGKVGKTSYQELLEVVAPLLAEQVAGREE